MTFHRYSKREEMLRIARCSGGSAAANDASEQILTFLELGEIGTCLDHRQRYRGTLFLHITPCDTDIPDVDIMHTLDL